MSPLRRFAPAASRIGRLAMSRLWKLPAAIAELTVGTMIVLYQLSVAKTLDRRALEAPRKPPN